ncbi:MAG: sugar transferase [Acidimicrobiales bacterium]
MDIGSTALGLCAPPDVMATGLSTVAPTPDTDLPATSAAYRWTKRTFDVVFSLAVLIVATPLWLLVAFLVGSTSRGPVFFRQSRVGRHGRSFTVLKFRSMCSDAEARLKDLGLYDTYVATGYKLPVADECRVTRVGRFLRKTSLDELPQLLNVLRGDMSLVGPRPVVPAELDSYGDLAHCYLAVHPGITGLWQVSGRSHIRFPERAHLDRDYFHRRSLRFDLAILARTPVAVVRGNGAY